VEAAPHWVAVGENAYGQYAPQPSHAMHGNRADGIVDAPPVEPLDGRAYQQAGDNADDQGGGRARKTHAGRTGYESCQHSVHCNCRVGFASGGDHEGCGSDRAAGTRENRHCGDEGGRFRRVRHVEAQPTDQEQETPEKGQRDVMRGYRCHRAVPVVAADSRPQNCRAGQGKKTANAMNDARPGHIHITKSRKPATTPCPQGEEWKQQDGHEQDGVVEIPHTPPFGQCADGDTDSDAQGRHLPEEWSEAARIIGSHVPEKKPASAARHRKAGQPKRDNGQGAAEKGQERSVGGILGACQTGRQHCQASRHQKHEATAQQLPCRDWIAHGRWQDRDFRSPSNWPW